MLQPPIPPLPPVDVYPTCMIDPVGCFFSGVLSQLSQDASAFLLQILNDVADTARFSPANGGFMAQYSLGLTIALFVLCFLLMRLFYKMSRHPDKMPEYRESLLHHLPIGLALCVVGPGFGALLAGMSDSLTDAIISANGSGNVMYDTVNGAIDQLKVSSTPSVAILLLFGLIIAGVMVILTLLLQTLALYLTGSVMAIAFVMTIDPELRRRAMKLPMTWLGVLLAKPLLFFMMGMVVRLITDGGLADNPIVSVLLALLALIVVSLAPLTLRKYAPIIPGGGDATASEAGGAMLGGAGDVATTATNPVLHTSGGGGGAGGGGTNISGASNSQVAIGNQRSSSPPSSQPSMSMPTSSMPAGSSSSPLTGFLNSSAAPAPASAGLLSGGASGGAAGAGAVAGGAAATGALAAAALPVAVGVGAYKAAKGLADSAAPNIDGSE